MIGFVIVSHSSELALGVREIVHQMVQDRVPIAVAGGTDNPDAPIGTDPMRVLAAIETVYSTDGVVVLMDLGSALMSAEAAIEFLPPEQRPYIHLCEAPVVEGTLAAAVRAMAGGSLAEVMAEARGALQSKHEQLASALSDNGQSAAVPPMAPVKLPTNQAGVHQLTVTLPNRLGLHARPAAKLVELAARHNVYISVVKDNRHANVSSINQLITLGARQGDQLHFHIQGEQAEAAAAAISALVADNLGDRDENGSPTSAAIKITQARSATELWGAPASPGIAIGPVLLLQPTLPEVREVHVDDPTAEWWRFQDAVAAALIELNNLRLEMTQQAGPAEAEIFAVHGLMVHDPELQGLVQSYITNQHLNAEAAWQKAIVTVADRYRAQEIVYLRERADDILDIGQRVLRHLTGSKLSQIQSDQPVIVVTYELTPSATSLFTPDRVLGIISELGGATSHSAILARSLGIPAVVGASGALKRLQNGQIIALNGSQGQIWLKPDAQQLASLQQVQAAWQIQQQTIQHTSHLPAILQDGTHMEVMANINTPQDIHAALAQGAEGVGLFRTEFLFMGRSSPPTEEEHYVAYITVAQALGHFPLIIRTLDIGADKPVPYLGIAGEPNPFLGWRGIRFCLDRPDLFKPQLRALLRASALHDLKIMLPMVSTLEEVEQAKVMLARAQSELRAEGLPFREQLAVGMMVETPAAVLMAPQFAQVVDFFSIGTNDLTQYIMAADRGNVRVAELATAVHPALLHAIQQVAHAAHAAGIPVGLCGELAGNPLVTALLLGLGIDELSMSAGAIPLVKARIRELTVFQSQAIAEKALLCKNAVAVTNLLETSWATPSPTY